MLLILANSELFPIRIGAVRRSSRRVAIRGEAKRWAADRQGEPESLSESKGTR